MKIRRFGLLTILLLLFTMLLLSACAAPADKVTAEEAVAESCTAEVPIEPTTEPTPEPTPEPWLDYAINSPELAEETVRAEIKKMQELGLLSEKLSVKDGPADKIIFFDQPEYLERTDRPYFAVRWYSDSSYGNDWAGENRYSINANLDVQSGKIMYMSIEAAADENAEVVYTVPKMEYDEKGNPIDTDEVWLYHQNFYDIFDEGMTVERFGSLLNEYWGFPGWKIAGGGAFNPATPLEDISSGTSGNRYVPLKFEGDEENKHMYLQISEFPGRVCLMFGTNHAVG